jgi:hypothetical protein
MSGDARATLVAADQALTLEDGLAHPQFFGIARAMRGWALSSLGREQEGVAELEKALAAELRASHIWAGMTGVLLAEIHLRAGRRAAARDLLDQVRSLTQSMPGYFYAPELLRVEAEWLREAGQGVDARRLLLQAIGIARQHGSSALAVRSALALAREPSAHHEADLKLLADVQRRVQIGDVVAWWTVR